MPSRHLVALLLPLVLIGGFVLAAPTSDDPNAPVRSLTLEQAETTALRNQPTLTQAHGLLEAAEGRVEESRAGYLPQVTLNGTYERTTGNFAPRPGALPTCVPTGGMAGTGGTTATTCTSTTSSTTAPVSWDPKYNYFLFGATATQLIYDFGLTSGRWRSAGANRA
ncbi:MAG TPA: TolC family protein, partial [Polyangia bacterium]